MREVGKLNFKIYPIMNKKTKALLFNLLCFTALFLGARYCVSTYFWYQGIWISLTAFVITLLLSPKFQVVKTSQGEKLLMSWLFLKGVKEIK